jgi:hypothetical protein
MAQKQMPNTRRANPSGYEGNSDQINAKIHKPTSQAVKTHFRRSSIPLRTPLDSTVFTVSIPARRTFSANWSKSLKVER